MGKKWSLTEEQSAAISARKQGHVVSEETRRKLSEINSGKTLSEETRKRIGDTQRGRKVSDETRQRMREAQSKRTPEQNKRRADSLRGRKLTEEHIAAQKATKMAKGIWKPIGHTYVRKGYRWIKMYEGRNRNNYEAEHRVVIERILGRPLLSEEHVHHVDGDSLNNDPGNLVLVSKREHGLLTNLLTTVDKPLANVIVRTLMSRFPDLDL